MEVNDQVLDDHVEDDKEIPLEETIRNSIAEVNASKAPPAPANAELPIEAKVAARDEAGKFVETPKEPKRETLTLKLAAPVIDGGVSAIAPIPIKAPDSLKPELKAKFGELPPEWQQEWQRREADAHKAITKNDEDRTFGRRVNEIVSPYLPTIRAEGGTPEKAIESLLQTAHVLRAGTPAQKTMALRTVAQQFNVDLSLPLQQGPSDPNIAHLQRQVQELTGQLQGFTQQHQFQENNHLESEINRFGSMPGHEHFSNPYVQRRMGELMLDPDAPISDMEEAYKQAIWLVPEIRSSLIASQSQAESEKRLAEAKAKADAARRAGGSVSGGPGAARALNGSGAEVPLEETIRAAIRESNGRV